MTISRLGCCAVSEIQNLHHATSAKAAMHEFCEKIRKVSYTSYREVYGDPHPGAYYIFTEVTKIRKIKNDGYITPTNGYGRKFMEFIKENKLGQVVLGQRRVNRVNHPNHTIQIYIWTPAKASLIKWYKENK